MSPPLSRPETGPAARWRPSDLDPLAEGLLVGFHTFAKAAVRAAPAPGLEAERALIAEAAAERAALPAEAGPHLRDEAAECEAILRQSNWRPPAWAEAEEAPQTNP